MTNDNTTATDAIEAIKTKAVADAKKRQAKGKAKPKAKAKAKAKSKKAKTKAKTNVKPKAARTDSKQARFIAAMRTARGISINEAVKEFGWQAHTVRGAVAGALKKKLKLKVESEHDDKRGTVYRIPA